MMFITRSIVAAFVIVGTVALSLGASFGLSVLIWQDLLGIQLYWIVLALAVILLLAVGSDYNLLLISRFKEEIGAGLNTGIIRAMAGSGAVVTAAGLVFAATMASFVFADLRILGQIGTTIAPRSAVRHADRAVVHDPVHRGAARPLVLVAADGCARARPARCCSPTDHAHAVRQLLLWEDDDPAVPKPTRLERRDSQPRCARRFAELGERVVGRLRSRAPSRCRAACPSAARPCAAERPCSSRSASGCRR